MSLDKHKKDQVSTDKDTSKSTNVKPVDETLADDDWEN